MELTKIRWENSVDYHEIKKYVKIELNTFFFLSLYFYRSLVRLNNMTIKNIVNLIHKS